MENPEEITGTLENWSYDRHHRVFWGQIYGDTKGRFRDGTMIHTSACEFNKNKEGDIIETLNSRYKLGKFMETL